jgi:hypothetical protein
LLMVTKKKSLISGSITETHGKLRDRISLTKSDFMVSQTKVLTEPLKELNGVDAKEY